ncbi:MAG: SAP domain-containing protein [Propionibacteriaceae bacterium]|nr:SAP domain-containing protein [Propionibacteriaceae bacterium]
MPPSPDRRPALTRELAGAEFARWYWLKDELVSFARSVGLPSSASKDVLTRRITAFLDGVPFAEPARKPPSGAQLRSGLTAGTVIPVGQRCSQVLRAWFEIQIGPGFHFDAHMRAFIAAADGVRTLGDAVAHWLDTRACPVETIDPQFEYNRFTRLWRRDHPDGRRSDLLAAWQVYRNQAADERGRA